jgi:hypothetical protein
MFEDMCYRSGCGINHNVVNMIRVRRYDMKRANLSFLTLIFVFAVMWVSNANSATISATSCSTTHVQAAINSAVTGDTVAVPSGNCTWSSAIAVPATKDLSIIGAGVGNTVITCSSGESFSLGNAGNSSASRVSGFTFINGPVGLTGLNPNKAFRVDHCRITHASGATWQVSGYNSGVHFKGLIDNNEIVNLRIVVYGTIFMMSEPGMYQHKIWATDPDFGGPTALYIEDNIMTVAPPGLTDANYGGRYVFRYNTVTTNGNTYFNEFHGVQGDNRAGQRWEIYGNTFINTGSGCWTTSFMRGASGQYFNNTLTGSWNNGALLKLERSCETKAPYGLCDGSWNIDGNTSGGSGYPCRDQIGRVRDATPYSGSGAWPAQAIYPAYDWNNKKNGTDVAFSEYAGCSNEYTYHVVENRDYYSGKATQQTSKTSPFDGTTGVGYGTLANRPSTCTTGVGYWATDQGTWNKKPGGEQGILYTCSSTNNWSTHYIPYTYPHPLTEGIDNISTPKNLRLAQQ